MRGLFVWCLRALRESAVLRFTAGWNSALSLLPISDLPNSTFTLKQFDAFGPLATVSNIPQHLWEEESDFIEAIERSYLRVAIKEEEAKIQAKVRQSK